MLKGSADAPGPTRAPSELPARQRNWKLTYEVLDPDGAPTRWHRAVFEDGAGKALSRSHVSASKGALDVAGSGHLLVVTGLCPPWASELLVPPASGSRHLVVHLDAGLAVAGAVLEQDGVTPCKDVSISVTTPPRLDPWRPGAHQELRATWKRGRFRCTGLPPGPVRLSVVSHDHTAGRDMEAEAQAGDEDLRLVLSPQGLIAFRVVDETTGLAPQTMMLRISEVTDGGDEVWLSRSWTRFRKPHEAECSEWRIADLGRTYRFHVEARNYEPIEALRVTVPKSGGKQVVTVSLRPAPGWEAGLTIRLRMEEGGLPTWLAVTPDARGGSIAGDPMRVEDERIVLKLLPGDQHVVLGQWMSPDPKERITFTLPFELKPTLRPGEEREVEVTLKLGGWAVIRGELDVEPVGGPGSVRLVQGEHVLACQPCPYGDGEESYWRLRVLPPGAWTLKLKGYVDGREVGRTAKFDVQTGEITYIDARKLEACAVSDE